jgi:hypothetical protein
MKSSHIALGIVTMIAMLLPARAGRGLAFGPQASGGSLAPATVLAEPGWHQVNSDGFGDAGATEVTALAVYGSYLYAGTHHATELALILRSADGVAWNPVIDPGFGNPHDTAPPAILDLTVYGSYLYASTGRGDSAAKIFRTINGVNWAPVVNSGFADPDNVDITALAGYGSRLYAGVTNLVDGVEIWRSYTGDSNSWTRDTPDSLVAAPASVSGFAEFGGALYAAIESDGPAQIWRTFGGGWAPVVSDGFEDPFTTLTGGLVVFGGYLYVGAGNTEEGVQLWRSHDGETWETASAPGASDANNEEIDGLSVFDNHLYAAVRNGVTGLEVWRSADGAVWEQSNQDGFGDANNTQTNGNNATAAFLSRLFVGTANTASGGELWRLTPAGLPGYGLDLSPGASQTGLPGGTVIYTLTASNSGSMEDTYALATAGNTWPASLSAASIMVPPGASGSFTVAVTIPGDALAGASDSVTVTATSQGDSSLSDTATLTTTCLLTAGDFRLYLPLIMNDEA